MTPAGGMPKDTDAERRRQLKAGAIHGRQGFTGRPFNKKRTASLLDVVREPMQRKRLAFRRGQRAVGAEVRVPYLDAGKMKSEHRGHLGDEGRRDSLGRSCNFF